MAETIRLGDQCLKIGSGATPRGGKESYLVDGPIALIRSQNIYNDSFSRTGLAFISPEQAMALQNVEVKEDDVLLNITGDSVARACQVDPAVLPARVNQHVAIIRPNPKRVDARFLRYFLITPGMQAHMLGLAAAGATRNALTKSMIEGFQVPGTRVEEQRAIASILSALDDKIELNRRMNETLEAMARAIFKDWFVDFGPVRTKMAMRGEDLQKENVARAPYLAPDIWNLFPDRLDDEGKPEGWTRQGLRDVAHILSGGTPSKENSALWNGVIPWISPKVMNSIHVADSEDRVTDAAIGNGTRLAPSGSTLLMVRGMGLHHGVRISQARIDVAFNQDVKALVPRGVTATHLLFAMLDSAQLLFSKVESSGHGTGKLPTEIIDALELFVPPQHVAERLISVIEPLNESIASNSSEICSLAATRDLLLPKLMSGEIRIRDAERIVEEAL